MSARCLIIRCLLLVTRRRTDAILGNVVIFLARFGLSHSLIHIIFIKHLFDLRHHVALFRACDGLMLYVQDRYSRAMATNAASSSCSARATNAISSSKFVRVKSVRLYTIKPKYYCNEVSMGDEANTYAVYVRDACT